ncbi:MAG: SHOCT domain-containing protein [Ruminococcus flavefaciens]
MKNNELFDKLYRYQRVMSWVRSLLSQALITKTEYAKIDTMMAKKYGISSCSIFR